MNLNTEQKYKCNPFKIITIVITINLYDITCLSILSNISLVLSVAVRTVSNSIASESVYFATWILENEKQFKYLNIGKYIFH